MTYTQPLVVAADVGSPQRSTCCSFGGATVSITSQSESPAGFRPTVEQLTRGRKNKSNHALNRRCCVRGSWQDCGRCADPMVHKRQRALHTHTHREFLCVHMMYTITRGPSKLVTQRRTGSTQQNESKFGDLKLKPTSWLSSNSPPPKIVFNRLNGKRYHGAAAQRSASPAEGFTAAHEENVRFVCEAWQEVEQKKLGDEESADSQGPVQYAEKTPSAAMKNFVPIDLEEWWAQRFLANIANLS